VIVVRARTRDAAVACPGCGTETARLHGYHDRTVADVPVGGRRVQVLVRARRLVSLIAAWRGEPLGVADAWVMRKGATRGPPRDVQNRGGTSTGLATGP
jgi:transposase